MKRYISPKTDIVSVAIMQHLLENSIVLSSTQATVDGSNNYNTLSRRGSIWADDEEEDD